MGYRYTVSLKLFLYSDPCDLRPLHFKTSLLQLARPAISDTSFQFAV